MAEYDLAAQIAAELQAYDERVAADIDEAAEKCASGLKKDLKPSSPKLTGDYGKSWAIKSDKSLTKGRSMHTVHNKKHYQLTHLLERPHSGPYGHGIVPGRPHIAPAEKKWTETFEKQCEEAVKG